MARKLGKRDRDGGRELRCCGGENAPALSGGRSCDAEDELCALSKEEDDDEEEDESDSYSLLFPL